MDFVQSLTYLNSFYDLEKTMTLPADRRWKLARMRKLLEIFGQPHKSFLPVVIVGTKGKGSTGFFLQSILKEAGISAGFYSSPHLESPRERIRIQGEMISTVLWAKILTRIKKRLASESVVCLSESTGPFTYFEVMTLMAVLAFKEAGVKVGVFEAGMGGRLDAVNALDAPIVVVTPIHLDHQEFLGSTLSRIAGEKAAVIHSGNAVIMAPQSAEVEPVIRRRAVQQGARLFAVTQKSRYPTGLLGHHQAWNAAVATETSKILLGVLNDQPAVSQTRKGRSDWTISVRALKAGLASVQWPGRFEVMRRRRSKVILDGAHNPASVQVLVDTLRQTEETGGVLIFGVTRDKDSKGMLKLLAQIFSTVIFAPLSSARGKSPAELCCEAAPFFPVRIPAKDIKEALHYGKILAEPRGSMVVTGSFYLVGAARAKLRLREGRL